MSNKFVISAYYQFLSAIMHNPFLGVCPENETDTEIVFTCLGSENEYTCLGHVKKRWCLYHVFCDPIMGRKKTVYYNTREEALTALANEFGSTGNRHLLIATMNPDLTDYLSSTLVKVYTYNEKAERYEKRVSAQHNC